MQRQASGNVSTCSTIIRFSRQDTIAEMIKNIDSRQASTFGRRDLTKADGQARKQKERESIRTKERKSERA